MANSNESSDVKYPVNRAEDPETWWNAVYSDTVLITQLDDGAGELATGEGLGTSSNSAPRPVINLLEQLHLRDHDQVVEIGTGTGWTAALLCHRLGEENVTSIEIDPQVAEEAKKNIRAACYHPRLVVGDGARCDANGATYDRVHVTCAVERVPYAWVEQTRVPGRSRFEVEQYGARRLWAEVEAAYLRWVRAGRPGRERFGMTVTPQGERIWLDEPEHVISAADLPSSRSRR